MLILQLIRFEWLKNIRSHGFYRNLAMNILMGFFALYFAAILLIVGFTLDKLLEKAHDSLNPTELFNGAMLYLLLGSLAFRFFMQQLNTINLQTYQVLPVKRSTLINFLLLKPLFNPANYFLLLLVIPFSVRSVALYYSAAVALRFVFTFVLMTWFNSLMAAYLKRRFGSNLLSFITIIVLFAAVASLEYFGVFSLFKISMSLCGFVVFNPFGLLIPALAVISAYSLNRMFFAQNFYPEKFNRKMKGDRNYTADLSFLNRFGMIGELIGLELKLILRHKRTKSVLYMSGFFLLYGLMFYTQKHYEGMYGLLFFVAMFMTGSLMLMYSKWIISWDGAHFDGLMTKNIPVRMYINANYYLLTGFNVLCFILTTPYFFFGKMVIYNHIAAFVFNSGVNVFLLLFFATYNTRRIDLSRSSAMNYQGTSFKDFLFMLPIMFLPMVIVGGISMIASLSVALWTLTLLGVAGLLFRNQLITLCVNQFNKRKYKLSNAFRESEF